VVELGRFAMGNLSTGRGKKEKRKRSVDGESFHHPKDIFQVF
jgi:hypothetical protein